MGSSLALSPEACQGFSGGNFNGAIFCSMPDIEIRASPRL